MSDSVTILIPATRVKALLVIAATKDVRYYLNGVAFDGSTPGRVHAVATDGHRLLALNIEDNKGTAPAWPAGRAPVIVPRELLESVKPIKNGRTVHDLVITLTWESDRLPAQVSVKGITVASGGAIDGAYPDWRRVFPRATSGKTAQFNAGYVGEFQKVHELLGGAYSPQIAHNGDGGALVTFPGHYDAMAVLMPMRADNVQATPYDWLAPKESPVKVKETSDDAPADPVATDPIAADPVADPVAVPVADPEPAADPTPAPALAPEPIAPTSDGPAPNDPPPMGPRALSQEEVARLSAELAAT